MTTQERQEIKDWGRTVARLRREGSFAALLHAEIKVSHLTVKEIAAACNTSSASINKWKGGEVYPAVHYLYRLAKCLHPVTDVSSAYMLYTMKINAERD
jgi:transcriptional regulator with XRE-family HTH domain